MSKNGEHVNIGFKLDGKNFPIWSRLMLVEIGGLGKLEHIEGDEVPPNRSDPEFKEWQKSDFKVFSWLVQNMEPRIVVQFAQHTTAKAIWKSLVTTFGVLTDPVQIYDLEVRTNKMNQGNESLEDYWAELQNLWVSIDSRKACPYDCCDKAIKKYREENETKRLYQFLGGLNDRYDGIHREILKESIDNPSAEAAFSRIRQEAARTVIWKPTAEADTQTGGIGFGFGAQHPSFNTQHPGDIGNRPPTRPPHRNQPPPPQSFRAGNRTRQDRSRLHCTHCGMAKHTRETCFQLVGFPEWWEDNHKLNRGQVGKGKAAIEVEEANNFAVPAGNQEAAYTGDDGNRIGENSGGGNRRGMDGVGREEGGGAARVAVRESQMNEGKGLGFKPSPPVYALSDFLPPKPPDLLHYPHTSGNYQFRPHSRYKSTSTPLLCKNRFSNLENEPETPVACQVSRSNPVKTKGWIFYCGATDTMTYDKKDIT